MINNGNLTLYNIMILTISTEIKKILLIEKKKEQIVVVVYITVTF